ncbi:3',5'-cyclic-AMP phosphodiesterase [Erwinia tracheiphila]|uniref:3',5'-cyclic adenosine monophosphate phosphodiesterase CpdA n=1 Tax=Erwinia tracheiphila TaxID=65700 RepID=A0A0M2KDJ0_9GAMM|nr:3',5'-cyclic-AMP phosphodiesterase [Erwinia tracheiphila]AXF78380.1 3',5'-cyclic-AMP phosphodiesterase [Erwinia tracheiphila]EOS95764.1 cyclic 3',5'-adenosine monophosphate phosphodiesterase [Erwinia tracheiphila PSU-1]KKF37435.1 diguanylate phosphodiesterase [Erwinia tracheiphila]UIA82886.1 3',5'-cyclic-AMP phosphodiesterase [Erwinia tracheiphila]UIA88830.1 3',5'-cyclic-AMP phosphodiesterase [Erwinia tracheiphila]
MDSLLKIPAQRGTGIRILQITDSHLFAGKHETLLGVNTWASFDAVLQAISASKQPFDLIVATGDLAQDHSVEAYQHFAEGIAHLSAPCVWLPGNHDFQPVMFSTLAETNITDAKHVIVGAHWQIVLLDTQVFGVPYGELSEYQLEWLDNTLARQSERHSLVLLHHHPVPSGCNWLDQHSLRNSSMLEAVLQRYPLASTLLCGHIHQELDLNWNGRRLLATPSTCVQFKPHCTNFTIDSETPGWRWLELYEDGRVETGVERLQTRAFSPDLDAEGY